MSRADQTTTALSGGLPQRVVLGLLIRAFPPGHVDQIVDVLGRREQRHRLLPARLMVYFTLALWIFGELPYEEVLGEIVRGIPGLTYPPGAQTASAAAIGRARRRLGVEPLRLLFERAAAPAAVLNGPDPLLPGGWRTLRLGRIAADVPDTLANRAEFAVRGSETGSAGAAAGPRVYLSLLTDDLTHRVVAASVGGGTDGGRDRRLLASVSPGSLVVLDDERPLSAGLWTAVGDHGGELLWPVPEGPALPVHHRLPDGSGLSRLPAAAGAARIVRVIERGSCASRLVTSILDHRKAPADRLTAVHDRNRAHGNGFRGITAYQGGDRIVLRSKSPDLVRQELYAMLCVHHAIGELVDFTLLEARQPPVRSRQVHTHAKRPYSGALRPR
ncbi:transposase domain-containing protein [Actinocrinis puniceicyclus]|uniref:Transposase domain-containing protein n=1 Tax=Actinocrinis puniceicyclus TaxID=977794 RepID=A0A8J8B9W7_9ACTN|nr:transposase domain-containing protein [Actinocrinis puniceicyclus]MBS2961463.1 transposase domain-containing protein [Actinocrinis puniceicyclus]